MTSKQAQEIIRNEIKEGVVTFFTLRWLMEKFEIKEVKKYEFTSNVAGARVDIFASGYGQTMDKLQSMMDEAFRVSNLDIDWLNIDNAEDSVEIYKEYGYEVAVIGR